MRYLIEDKIDDYLSDGKKIVNEGFFSNIIKKAAKRGLKKLREIAVDFLILLMQHVNQEIQSTISDITIGTALVAKKKKQIDVLEREANYHKEKFLYILSMIESEIEDFKEMKIEAEKAEKNISW